MSGRVVAYSSSPLLASRTPVWRSKLIVAGIALGFVALAGRAAWVQVWGNEFYLKQGEVRFARTLELPANRGRILDRNGQLLATSVPVPSIWAMPEDMERDPAKLKKLAKLLDMPLADLDKRLADDEKSFVWLKRDVDEAVARQVAALDIKGIYQRKEYRRQYPEAEAAAHIVGFTNIEDKGQEGVELAFEQQLAGRAGSRRVIKDRLGRIVEDVGQMVPPVDGRDIQLAIDSKIQFFAYQQLRDAVVQNKARAGSVIVLDAHTGEVLALANYPSYNPGHRQNLSGSQLRNRALTDTFEPGSTMKPLIVSLALQKGMVRPDSVIQTNGGRMSMGGFTIRDDHPSTALTIQQVIQKSSNIGAAKLALQVPPREMWEWYSGLGFGQRPQVRFPGVVSGRLRPWKSWKPVEQATMAYGYGLSVSLVQLAHAYTTFARDGEIVPLSLLKTDGPVQGIRLLEPKVAQEMRQMLHLVTQSGGTAPRAQTLGYSVGGKTGTAHKQEGKGYAANKYRGVFVGMAPIDQPRIVVAVMIDEPSAGKYFGGDVAAPVFSATVQQSLRMLGVQPDMNVKPQITVEAIQESF